MLAILFFLVCAVVGSVILAGASSSAGRMKNLGENERVHDALSSAARLVVNRMSDETNGKKLIFDLQHADPAYGIQPAGTVSTDSSGAMQITNGPYTLKADADGSVTSTAAFSFTQTAAADGSSPLDNTAGGSWPGELWPADPLGSTFWKADPAKKERGLAGIPYDISGDLLGCFWNESSGPYTDKNDIRYGWTGTQVPSGGTWRYSHENDVVGGNNVNTYATGGGIEQEVNEKLKVRSYLFTAGDKTEKKDQAIVDVYMDQFFNLEIHIYPADDDLYESTGTGKDKVTFENAPQRYLIRIPAHTGTVDYNQNISTTVVPDTEASSGQQSTDTQDGSAGENPDGGSDTVTYSVAVTRSVTLSGFYWKKARIYTGDSVNGHVYAYDGYIQPAVETE